MKTASIIILAIAAVTLASEPRYNIAIFHDEINAKCLNRLWTVPGQENDFRPTGQTLESFIAMVEKVEANHEDWNIFDITRALLKRFAFEEMEFRELASVRSGRQKDTYKTRWNIMAKLLGDDTDTKLFVEDDLTEEEKCTMYFMMGHLVNNTYREGVDIESSLSDVPLDLMADGNSPGIQFAPPPKLAVQPREQGVVNVRSSSHQAIAISKVLNALLASQNNIDQAVHLLYGIAVPESLRLNPLIGVTLGDVLSLAVVHHESIENGAKYFGPGGAWNSTACPTEFVLNQKPEGATNALLRGAVDGVLLSHAVSQMSADTEGLKLSRVLRMYYSAKGIPQQNSAKDGISYCRRREVLDIFGQNSIHDSVLAYCHVLMFIENGQELVNSGKVMEAVKELDNALAQMERETGTKECQDQAPRDQPTCETPTNVFVVLDSSERQTDGLKAQEDIVGYLSSRLDFGRGVGSLNIFYDSKNSHSELSSISYNDTDSTCGVCNASRADERNDYPERAQSEVVVLDGLNKTLQRFEMIYDLEPGIPNKVAVMFHYENIRESNEKRLTGAVNILRDGHRDTRLIVVGSDKQALSILAAEASNVVTGNTESVAQELISKICKVPAIFQFNRCFDHKKASRNEEKNVYTGYVTDNHIQFWAMYPEYFLKSYNMKFKFEVENGDITVCEQRGVQTPGYKGDSFSKEGCKSTDPNNRKLEFTFNNPCEGYQVHDCPSINFAIVGDSKAQTKLGCPGDDDKCRRVDQIKFHVSHEGVFCSGSDFVRSSVYLTVAAAAMYLFRRF